MQVNSDNNVTQRQAEGDDSSPNCLCSGLEECDDLQPRCAYIEHHKVEEDEDEMQHDAKDQLQLANHSLGVLATPHTSQSAMAAHTMCARHMQYWKTASAVQHHVVQLSTKSEHDCMYGCQ